MEAAMDRRLIKFVFVTIFTCCACSIIVKGINRIFAPYTSVSPGQQSDHATSDAQSVEKDSAESNPSNDTPETTAKHGLRLGTIATLKRVVSRTLTTDEKAEIRRMIRSLASINDDQENWTYFLQNRSFRPLDQTCESESVVSSSRYARSSLEFKRLIELGPDALPFLLESLDDNSPTAFVINNPGFCQMAHVHGVRGNPVKLSECDRIESRHHDEKTGDESTRSHVITIGDICFVIIGQIVGRDYRIMNNVPQCYIEIASPTTSERIRRQVREIWSSDHPSQSLLDSLQLDLATEISHSEKDYQGKSSWQCAAAERLLYYFPQESAGFVADRLRKFDVDRECTARSSGASFVEASAFSDHPQIKTLLRQMFERATNPHFIVASMKSVSRNDHEFMVQRMKRLIEDQTRGNADPKGHCYKLLVGLCQYAEPEAKEVFRQYLGDRTVQHCRLACLALRKVQSELAKEIEWTKELITPLLDDRREAPWDSDPQSYAGRGSEPMRICDEAAETIASGDKRHRFNTLDTTSARDARIADIKSLIKNPCFDIGNPRSGNRKTRIYGTSHITTDD